jgi:hypothetical protein
VKLLARDGTPVYTDGREFVRYVRGRFFGNGELMPQRIDPRF